MRGATWSESEKSIAPRVFGAALQRELVEVMVEFKASAASTKCPADMWAVQEYLARTQLEIDSKYDLRYSQLEPEFDKLLREKRIKESDPQGLAEDKLASKRTIGSLRAKGVGTRDRAMPVRATAAA